MKKLQKFLKKHTVLARNISHWSIFIFTGLAMTFSIADVAAKETVGLVIANPDLAQYSYLVKYSSMFY